MTSKLYIASKPAVSEYLNPQHMYLVYDPDGNPNSGDEMVIRGGPPGQTTGFTGFINIEIAVPILDSEDGPVSDEDPPYTVGDLPSVYERNFTLVEEGAAADALWATMVAFAISLSNDGNAAPGDVYSTGFTYAPTNSNSNSTVTSVMASAGLDIRDYLPVLGGDLDGDGIKDGSSPPVTARVTFANVPGAHALLSGGQDDTFDGGTTNVRNVFYDTADSSGSSGNDVFYGGVLNNKVFENEDDGVDSYFYIQPGSAQTLTWSAIRDSSGTLIGAKMETPDGKFDELYSVENIAQKTYNNTHIFMYQFNAGIDFQDLSATQLASLNASFNNEYEFITAAKVDLGGGKTQQFSNFGSFVGTEYNDKFALNLLIGRNFDGGDGVDTVDYSDIDGVFTVNMRADQKIAYLASTPGVTDSLESIETVIGAQEFSNVFVGTFSDTPGNLMNWEHPQLLTYVGGNQADTYVFDKALDEGVVVIIDDGTSGVDKVIVSNAYMNLDDPSIGERISLDLETHGGRDYVLLGIDQGSNLYPQFLQLRLEEDSVEEIYINNVLFHFANLRMWMENTPSHNLYAYEAAHLHHAVYKGGPVSNGENYDENVTPTLDGSGNVAGMAVSSAVGGQWTTPAIAAENQHEWVVTGLTSNNGYSTLNAVAALKDISFADGITASDVRLMASNSPSGNANLTIRIDSLNYTLTVTGFEAGRTINGIGFYDNTLHGHISAASAVVVEDTAAGQYTVQYNSATTYTPGSVSGLYFLETLNFTDTTVIDLQNDQLTFTGTSSNETLYGLNTRADILVGLGGNDTMYGYGGADTFYGGDGADLIYAGDGDDTLYGDDGNDILYAGNGADVLFGGAGNDNLNGEAGNDTLTGGAGDDALRGGAGDDTYIFSRNFSATTAGDIVYENASDGFDTIVLTDSIDPDEVYSWTDGSGFLWMQVGGTAATNTLKLQGSYSSTTGISTRVEQVVFDDTTVWDLTGGLYLRNTDTARTFYGTVYGDVLVGGSAVDTIYAYGGNDTLVGNGGNDALRGGTGDDTYVFDRNFSGTTAGDIVYENDGEGSDTIAFIGGIEAEEVFSWTDSSGYLWMQVGSTAATNTLKAQGSYSSTTGVATRIEQVVFDDATVWDLTQGLHLRNTDTARAFYGSAYGDILEGGSAAETIYGYGGNDTLVGNGGNDTLRGGDGNDSYLFGYGFSLNTTGDRIMETATGGTDTIRFTESIAPAEVYSWTDTSGYLWFQLGTNPASNTLKADGAYSASTGITAYVEQVAFDDTTVWDLTQGLHLRNNDTGRQMYGSALGDWIEGGAGADTLRGFGGDDILTGRGGNDALYGGAGVDTFVFLASDVGNGIDTLYDFSVTDDVIDLRDVLDSGYDPINDVLSDFVRFTNSGSNSKLEVDMDGAGTTYGWTQIATVNGHINLDAVTLETNGHLLAA